MLRTFFLGLVLFSMAQAMTTETVPNNSCSKSEAFLSIPGNCNAFGICLNGVIKIFHCPIGLHFDLKNKICTFPPIAGCAEASNAVFAATEEECPKVNPGMAVLLPDLTDCEYYYMCETGEKIRKHCPDNLHFNRKKKVCDYPNKAGCETEKDKFHPVEMAASQATGVPSPFCPVINGKYPIFFPHPTNCSTYYMCGNGLAYEFSCSAGLHFDVRKKVCDYPWRVKCANGGSPS